jgi:DNA-binding transcriptional ArsR family regulator
VTVGSWLRFEGMPDQVSALYNDLLEGSYDCVDRVILNAYFGRGQFGGGFRIWWRALHGSDENLDDNHLMRMAGRFSRRLRAWAKENQIPVVYSSPGERKHDLASEHLATHETKPGLFMILVSKAPALIWEAQMTGTGKLGQLVIKEPWPYVNHYSFHILDPDWGHLTIKMSGHPPFGAQVMLNGHEYVACQAQKAGVDFTKQDNCFTRVTNAADLAKVADTLSAQRTAERLRQLCERWIYSTCLCFALDLEEQKQSAFQYQYSVYQMEYSRNLLFCSGRQMDEIFQALIDRTRGPLNLDRVRTIFGDKKRPHYDKRKKNPTRWGVVVETPAYDVTIFKVHYGKMTLKIYTKGERVLRIEVILHNAREYRWGRSLPCFPDIVLRLRGILERFLNAVGCMNTCFVSDDLLEQLPEPTQVGETKVGGIDLNKLRMRRVAEAVLALSASPAGFTASDLARQVRLMSGQSESEYGPRRAAYDIKKLRAKGMVCKIGKSRRYEPLPEGLPSLTALLVLREKIIRPLLAATGQPQPASKPVNPTLVDQHYESLRAGMRNLFTALGIAA